MYLRVPVIVVALCLQAFLSATAADHPNIVIILADDMGYGDVAALNAQSRIPTPNLDSLAASGMTFTDAHTPSSVCTPTRYGLLTGRYCWRSRLKHGVLNGYSPHLIEPDRPTIASVLKERGYSTAVVGKWHLGLDYCKSPSQHPVDPNASPEDGEGGSGKGSKDGEGAEEIDFTKPVANGPNALGFDFSHVIPASLDFPPYVFVENGRVVEVPTLTQLAQPFPAFTRRGPRASGFEMVDVLDDLCRQAVAAIRRQAEVDAPFFVYFPLTAPHKPVLPHPRFRGTTDLGPYGDFVRQVDWTVGQVLSVLRETGAEENTLVIYTSDNGSFMYRIDEEGHADHTDDDTIQAFRASEHTANHVFRGTKADIWEAGHRVPFFARWPGKTAPGSRCDQTVCLTDLLATCAEAAGANLPNAAEDSFSMLSLLCGEPPVSARPPVVHHSAQGIFAVRDGKWKLVLGNGSGGRESRLESRSKGRINCLTSRRTCRRARTSQIDIRTLSTD